MNRGGGEYCEMCRGVFIYLLIFTLTSFRAKIEKCVKISPDITHSAEMEKNQDMYIYQNFFSIHFSLFYFKTCVTRKLICTKSWLIGTAQKLIHAKSYQKHGARKLICAKLVRIR